MILNHLALFQFRNLGQLTLDWNPGFNVIWGKNAQGKTNLLEAIYLLGQLKSFRLARGLDLIQNGCESSKISGKTKTDLVAHHLELTIHSNSRLPKINGKTVQRLSEYLGYLRAVLFSPEELGVVRGYPAGRRSLLDRAILLSDPNYLERVQEYTKILKHRNQLLKNLGTPAELESWSKGLARTGARIRHERLSYVRRLRPFLKNIYQQISLGEEEADLELSVQDKTADCLVEELTRELNQVSQRERDLGQSLAGPHRDDMHFYINGKPIKNFGSQGQQRSFLLAFKAAQVMDQEKQFGEPPLLLLDDLASELDNDRQTGFVNFLLKQKAQIFITTASPAVLAEAVKQQAGFYQVDHGRVKVLSPE